MRFPKFTFELPGWVEASLPTPEAVYPTAESRMDLVIGLAQENIAHGTGGPFGAAIFNQHTHQLIAPGVNLVTSGRCSLLHAEMVAIAMAQQVLGSFDLGAPGLPPGELVTSVEPCAMCFGAVPWSGVHRLVCGARDEDARAIGFDEGPKREDWEQQLRIRDIEVLRDVHRGRAADTLRDYAKQGGAIYNGRGGSTGTPQHDSDDGRLPGTGGTGSGGASE